MKLLVTAVSTAVMPPLDMLLCSTYKRQATTATAWVIHCYFLIDQVTYGTKLLHVMHACRLFAFTIADSCSGNADAYAFSYFVSLAQQKLTVRYFTACALQAARAGIAGARECQLASSALLPYLTPVSQQAMSAMPSRFQQALLTGSAEY